MKRYFLLVFVVTFQFGLSQPFSFSQRSEYISGTADFTHKKIIFSNPSDDSYVAWFTPTLTGLKLIVTEFTKGRSHYYSIGESQGESGQDAFKYEFSIDHGMFSKHRKLYHDFQLFDKDSLISTVVVKTYKNESRKKLLGLMTVRMESDPYNQFPLFRVSCLHGSENDYDYRGSFKGKVISAQGTVDGKEWEAKLLKMESVSLTLKVPQTPRFISKTEWQKHISLATR